MCKANKIYATSSSPEESRFVFTIITSQGPLVVHWGCDEPCLRHRNSLGLARLLEETKHYVHAAYLGSKLTLE